MLRQLSGIVPGWKTETLSATILKLTDSHRVRVQVRGNKTLRTWRRDGTYTNRAWTCVKVSECTTCVEVWHSGPSCYNTVMVESRERIPRFSTPPTTSLMLLQIRRYNKQFHGYPWLEDKENGLWRRSNPRRVSEAQQKECGGLEFETRTTISQLAASRILQVWTLHWAVKVTVSGWESPPLH